MSPESYSFLHQELRSISAQLRWTAVRDRFVYHKRPMQDFFSLAASQAHVGSLKAGKDEMAAIGPVLLPPPRSRRTSTRGRSPSLSSVVSDAVELHNALNSQDSQHSEETQQVGVSFTIQRNPMPTPVFQLPGIIETFCVKALPDTGSSQNVIDKNLVQRLFPSIPIQPIHESTDKLLVARDGQPVPYIGKVSLSWIFKDKNVRHRRWFYVVENCSKDVIIGNGFLRQTETMSKHRHRLELTKPSDPNSPPGHLLSEGVKEARRDECLRQLVLGRINSTDIFASLDTGCEANLMSIDFATSLALTILPLPTSEQHVRYADGRRGSMLGQVEVDWSFFDTNHEFGTSPICRRVSCLESRRVPTRKPYATHHQPWLTTYATNILTIGHDNTEHVQHLISHPIILFISAPSANIPQVPGFSVIYLRTLMSPHLQFQVLTATTEHDGYAGHVFIDGGGFSVIWVGIPCRLPSLGAESMSLYRLKMSRITNGIIYRL